MKRSDRLKLVERVARQHEDKAAQALQMAEQKLAFEYQQLADLQAYQDTYQSTQQQASMQGIGVQQYMVYQHFLDQIEVLISNQQRTIEQVKNQHQQLLNHWQNLYLRRKSLAQLAEKVSLEEFVAEEKQAQKQIDELVMQMHANHQR